MYPINLIPCAQELLTGPCPEPDASNPRLPNLFSLTYIATSSTKCRPWDFNWRFIFWWNFIN